MKDKLFEIFTFCCKNSIEFNLENNKESKNSVKYNHTNKKIDIVIADFQDEKLEKDFTKCLKELQDSIK